MVLALVVLCGGMYSSILQFFLAAINADFVPPAGMRKEQGVLVFSLAALYDAVCAAKSAEVDESYKAFRQKLYASTLNADLAKSGWAIEVFQSAGHVDQTLYCLKRQR